MKSLSVVLAMMMSALGVIAQTIVPPGPVRGVWDTVGNRSPFIVEGNISVLDSLIIKPGVNVRFHAGGFEIRVAGAARLVARGTESAPVVFEPHQGQFPGSWVGIILNNTGADDSIDHCVIRFASNGISVQDSRSSIRNSLIHSNMNSGLSIAYNQTSGGASIFGCTFNDNTEGIRSVSYNNGGGTIRDTIMIDRCAVYKNSGHGIFSTAGTNLVGAGAYMLVRITNSTVANNGGSGVLAETPSRGNADAQITNTIVAFNGGYGCANGARGVIGGSGIVYNCLWGNGPGNFSGISGLDSVLCCVNANSDSCDIRFNIYYDPLFTDTLASDFRLDSVSKCIDAGTEIVIGRIVRDPDGTLPDIGAFYYQHMPVAVSENGQAPNGYFLSQNYPNPFNPETRIKFQIPNTNDVVLKVYDILGREVATLVNERKPPGTYEAEFDGSGLASGVYLYRLKAGSFVETKKLILLR